MPNAQLLVFHTLTTHYTHTPTRRQARRFFVVKAAGVCQEATSWHSSDVGSVVGISTCI